jgi:hypothetical protein
MRVYDKNGTEQTLTWLYEQFGLIEIVDPESPVSLEGTYSVATLQEAVGPASISCWVLDSDGRPMPNVQLVFCWPDAPVLPGCGHLGKGVTGRTDPSGRVGFDVGKGAYYDPRTGKGPHDLWIFGRGVSERVSGLGMIGGTNHRHLDVTFQLDSTEPEPEPGPEPQPEPEPLDPDTAKLIRDAIGALNCVIDVLQQALAKITEPPA